MEASGGGSQASKRWKCSVIETRIHGSDCLTSRAAIDYPGRQHVRELRRTHEQQERAQALARTLSEAIVAKTKQCAKAKVKHEHLSGSQSKVRRAEIELLDLRNELRKAYQDMDYSRKNEDLLRAAVEEKRKDYGLPVAFSALRGARRQGVRSRHAPAEISHGG